VQLEPIYCIAIKLLSFVHFLVYKNVVGDSAGENPPAALAFVPLRMPPDINQVGKPIALGCCDRVSVESLSRAGTNLLKSPAGCWFIYCFLSNPGAAARK
jgi:hypothetical protein